MELNFDNMNQLSLNDLSEQFLQYQQEVSINKVKFSQVIKDNLLKQCEEVFSKNPQIKSFIWGQYTPYDHMTFVPIFNVQEFAFLSFIPTEDKN